MAWIIRKLDDTKGGDKRFGIFDEGLQKGDIVLPAGKHPPLWQVKLMMVPDLDYQNASMDQCFGYVRGVEAAVNVYAKETGRTKKRASR